MKIKYKDIYNHESKSMKAASRKGRLEHRPKKGK